MYRTGSKTGRSIFIVPASLGDNRVQHGYFTIPGEFCLTIFYIFHNQESAPIQMVMVSPSFRESLWSKSKRSSRFVLFPAQNRSPVTRVEL